VSPLWRNRLVVFVGAEHISVLKLGRGVKPKLLGRRDEVFHPSENQAPWQAALEALDAILAEPEWQAPDMDVVLSNRFVRYAVVPFNDQLKKYAEQEAFAKHVLNQSHGAAAGQWALRIQKAKAGVPALVGAVDQALVDALGGLCRAHGTKLHTITPYLTAVFNRSRGVFGEGQAWLVVAEAGYSLFALIDKGNFSAINGVFHSTMQELPALLDRENLVSGLSEPCRKVYWHSVSDEARPEYREGGYELNRLDTPSADEMPGGDLAADTGGAGRGGTRLDYGRPANQPRQAAGWMLLAAGIVLLLEMSISYGRLHSERRKIEQEMRAAGVTLDLSSASTGHRYTEKDATAVRDMISRLSAPWEELFSNVESIKNKKVAILSLDPDIQTGQLTIAGEAKDYAALLTFVAQLRNKKAFADVFLQRHEVKQDDPQHPIAFAVSMRWLRT